MPELTAAELAEMTGGRLVGPPDARVKEIRTPAEAGPADLAFIADEKHLGEAETCRAGVLIAPCEPEGYEGSLVVCEDPELAIASVLEVFAEERLHHPRGISPKASVSPSARIGEDVAIGDHAVVGENTSVGEGAVIYPSVFVGGNCRIGARTVIYANVSVHDRTTIGSDCVVHYGAVLGAEGFGFLQRDGSNVKLAQVGGVRIGDRVEIGALTSVDRAMIDETVIEDGVKIDNHCHIAHNCHIGRNCVMAGYSRLAGSVRLGQGVLVAVDVGIKDHVTVGEGAILAAGAGVHNDVAPGEVLLGYPARPIGKQRRIWALCARLPRMAEKLRELETKLAELEADRGDGQNPDG
ncbi:MAG: UDP-3-O-(3-hydroxymyristoyl)glucosamine N-acyltransferase [Candidatus Brocadiaceae bacterium]|jgi:UDP-3-O-[3-hydroxymyristoyl] glucosamine N-acyltransferase